MKRKIVLVLAGIMPCVVLYLGYSAYGASPPFSLQQLADTTYDWRSSATYRDPTDQLSQEDLISNCSSREIFPDISAVNYKSNGEKLTATIWLDKEIKDPIFYKKVNNQTFLNIEPLSSNAVFEKKHSDNTYEILTEKRNYRVTEPILSNTSSGYLTRTYDYLSGDGSIMIAEDDNSTSYLITFNTTHNYFDFHWPKMKKSLDSFDIGSNLKEVNKEDRYDVYVNDDARFKIEYPTDWFIVNSNSSFVGFQPISWIFLQFGITLQEITRSSFGSEEDNSDYKIAFVWDTFSGDWKLDITEFAAVTASGDRFASIKNYPMGELPFHTSSGQSNGIEYIRLNVNLTDVGYPQKYAILSDVLGATQISVSAFPSNIACALRDLTNWVELPPLEPIKVATSPSSLSMIPGGKARIAINVSSLAAFPTQVTFLDSQDQTYADTEYSGSNIALSPGERTTSFLDIEIPKEINRTALPKKIDLSLLMNVSSTTSLIRTSSGTFEAPIEPTLTRGPTVSLTIEKEPSIADYLKTAYDNSSSLLSGLEGRIVALSSISASLFIFIRWLRHRHTD